jgi:hypothetical protein
MGAENIYIREGDAGFIKKKWSYCRDSNLITVNVRARTNYNIFLDLHMPLPQESRMMREIQSPVQQLLSQQLQDQQMVRQQYPQVEELQTSQAK